MSDTYQNLILKQRESQETREQVNEWLRTNLDPDCDSLQKLVMDEAGEYIPGEQPCVTNLVFEEWLREKKESIYKQILDHISNVPKEVSVEVEDPTEPMPEPIPEVKKPKPKPKPKPKAKEIDPRVQAITTLLTNHGNLSEDDVRRIVREEIKSMFSKIIDE